ncbi:MAG: hypothetical protein LRS49_02925, partial [Desulfurococcales archaeon]|nr:hypothetical protein [Desulfurococcales archaeon]
EFAGRTGIELAGTVEGAYISADKMVAVFPREGEPPSFYQRLLERAQYAALDPRDLRVGPRWEPLPGAARRTAGLRWERACASLPGGRACYPAWHVARIYRAYGREGIQLRAAREYPPIMEAGRIVALAAPVAPAEG